MPCLTHTPHITTEPKMQLPTEPQRLYFSPTLSPIERWHLDPTLVFQSHKPARHPTGIL